MYQLRICRIVKCVIQITIVFARKYRRKVFYGEKREAVGKILRQLREWKGVKIVEAEACPDHVQMLVGDTAETVRIKFHGISERQEQHNAV